MFRLTLLLGFAGTVAHAVVQPLIHPLTHGLTPTAAVPAMGTYSYTLIPDSSDDVKGVVNHTVEHMSFLTRPTARNRLNRLNPVPRHVQVTITPDSLCVSFEGLNPIDTPLDGTEVPWRSSINNDDYSIRAVVGAGTVSQVISAKDGERTNAYVFDDGSTHLAMHVTLRSHRLPEPLEYTLVYRRDSTSTPRDSTAAPDSSMAPDSTAGRDST